MLKVYWGSMFAAKTSALLREIIRAEVAGKKLQVFKYDDNRYSKSDICTHDGHKYEAITVKNSSELNNLLHSDTEVIIIDDGQFFDRGLINLVNKLVTNKKITVIIAGLDMDRFGRPFGIMPELAAVAEEAVKLRAICKVCGQDAYVSYSKVVTSAEQVVIGGKNEYEARCRYCAQLDKLKEEAANIG